MKYRLVCLLVAGLSNAVLLGAAGPASAQAIGERSVFGPAPAGNLAAADPEQAIQDAMARLLPPDASRIDRYQFESNLRLASRGTLLDVTRASTFAEAVNVLLPDAEDTSIEKATSSMQSIGDLDQDYVYTAVAPCRIADTRPSRGGTGAIAAGNYKDFYVYGDGTTIGGQGGNIGGCPSPRGEPRAVHVNVTAVPGGFNGFLTVFPTDIVGIPTVSLVNYRAGEPIANAGIIQTNYAIGVEELRVYAASNANVIVDVLGYYHEAGAIDEELLPQTLFFTSTVIDDSGVGVALCPAGSVITSGNCSCDNVNGTRNFGVLFGCQVASDGAVGGCFVEGLTYDPNLPNPEITVTAMCATLIPAGGGGAKPGSAKLLGVGPGGSGLPGTGGPGLDSELHAQLQLLRNQASLHRQRLDAAKLSGKPD